MTGTPAPLLKSVPIPRAYDSNITVSYVRTRAATAPISDESVLDSASYNRVKQATTYFDGLGRPLQTVAREATPGSHPVDIVTPVIYDNVGREAYKYLPYAQSSGTSTNDGSFKMDPFGDQYNFYKNTFKDAGSDPALPGEECFYSKTTYEPSPLGRVTGTMAAGNSWLGSNRGTSQLYLVNTVADSVRIWVIGSTGLTPANEATTNIPVSDRMYSAGELLKNVTIDENGNASVEYRDKEGQLIEKKVQNGEVAGDYSGYANWLVTSYVYDDLGHLRFVIPPKAVEEIKDTWILPADITAELCFRYEYDAMGRMIAKKVPGAGWVYMVYDRRDRLVFTQDGNQREKGWWMATLYDGLNRVVSTGMVQRVLDRSQLQGRVDSAQEENKIVTTSDGLNLEVMMSPLGDGEVYTALTITRYDDYRWTDKYNGRLDGGNNPYPEDLPAESEQRDVSTVGMVTGRQTRVVADPDVVNGGKWLTTVIWYDDKGRVIQTRSNNYGGGEDISISRYDFTGKAITSYVIHKNPSAPMGEIRVKTNMEYDHGGRLIEVWKMINDQQSTRALISRNHYDELGQLQRKELGIRDDNGSPVETLDYNYNIRGWLKGINAGYSHPEGRNEKADRWFGMELNYDWGSTRESNNEYNGNISSVLWRSRGDGVRRAYGYSYDRVGRLLGADFSENNGNGYTDNSSVNFDMVMGDGINAGSAYDENGNIKGMKHWGLKGTASALIDDLGYSYNSHSNKLRSVSEAQGVPWITS